MKNIAKFMLLPLLFMAILFIKPTYAYWANNISSPAMFMTTANILIGTWQTILPLDPETEYEDGDQFIYDDQVWTVVDTNVQPGPGETRMMVIIPGEGLVLVAITGDGNGKTIVVRINN